MWLADWPGAELLAAEVLGWDFPDPLAFRAYRELHIKDPLPYPLMQCGHYLLTTSGRIVRPARIAAAAIVIAKPRRDISGPGAE
jgi:hypothetical protein